MNPPTIKLAKHADTDSGDAATHWYRRTLAQPGLPTYFESDGARLHALTWDWSSSEKPTLLLVHGYRAHAHWWDWIAPALTDRYRVAALDLAGMGDSAHRAEYSGERFARDILAAIDHLGIAPATVIGHSYGGSRALLAAALAPEAIQHAIVIDSFFSFPELPAAPPGRPPHAAARIDPDLASALARFRLAPDQPAVPALVEHIARHSLRAEQGGWRWKFDARLQVDEEPDSSAVLTHIAARVDYVCGELSAVVDPVRAQRIVNTLPHARRLIVMPETHHHPMLDQPLALIAVLRALLA
ncbi:MAG: alpha/beta hydrolase [Pseudomonadota bacterium]